MRTKDIKIGKYYQLDIWDDELILVQCVDHDEGWFYLEDPYHNEWMIMDDIETDTIREIPKEIWAFHLMDLLVKDGKYPDIESVIKKFVKFEEVECN